jgi:hypothetical protein
MATSRRSRQASTSQSTFWSEEHLASHSQSQASEEDWTTTVATWPSNILGLLTAFGPDGWFGRTSPASCHRTEDGTLVPFSGAWSNSGMASPTECLTLSSSEFHSAAAACSLSDVLETGEVPQRYFLSATACKGILRRAAKRGRELPPWRHCKRRWNVAAQTVATTKPKPGTLIASTGHTAHCLNAGGMGRQDYETETLIAFSSKDHGADASAISPTLRAMGHAGSHANAGGQVAVAFQTCAAWSRTVDGP